VNTVIQPALREYQSSAIEQIRAQYRAGVLKVVLHMATGSGKTRVFCEILGLAHARGTRALVVVRGRNLIDQASKRLSRDGVPHGIIMSGRDEDHGALVRVCSIDTLYARRLVPDADLIIIDEAHQTAGDGYRWFIESYPRARFLAVTATPHLKKGMRHVADAVVRPITAAELTEQGFLVPLQYWAPETPDLSAVATTAGDYNQRDLGAAMRKAALSGNIVKTYQRSADGGRAILFAVDVTHSRQIQADFNAAGIPAVHVDATCSDLEREDAIARLTAGDVRVICSVGIMTTGVDIPACDLIIMARPTKSYNLWIQMCGRATRPCPELGKTHAKIFDHAGNVGRHGFLEDEKECCLDGTPPSKAAPTRTCTACYAVFRIGLAACPRCGELMPVKEPVARNKTVDENAVLGRVDEKASAWQRQYVRLVEIARRKNLKPGFVFFKIQEKFGRDAGRLASARLKKEPSWYDEIKRQPIPHSSPTSCSPTAPERTSHSGKMLPESARSADTQSDSDSSAQPISSDSEPVDNSWQ